MAEKITGRLKTPADENGNRVDVHLITTTEEVITPDGKTLDEVLGESDLQISDTKPTFSCMWFKPR